MVGGKFPDLFKRYECHFSVFSGIRFVFIVRNIYDVAGSWNRRALDPRDAWPIENDYRVAVKRWNDAVGSTYSTVQQGVDVADLKYEELFEGGVADRDHVRRTLFDYLGVKDSKESEGFYKHCFSVLDEIRAKRLKLEPFQVNYLK